MVDPLGNPVSGDPAALPAVGAFVDGLLRYRPTMGDVLAAADADAGHALANAYAAALQLFAETPGAVAAALPYLVRAEAAGGTARERATVALVRAWADERTADAVAIAEAAVAAHPRDLAMVKLGQYHAFNRGDLPALLRLALGALPACDGVAQAHGMAAFGYEQLHLIDEAEAAAERAIAIERAEPWAHHALLHVHLTRGDIARGLAFADAVADTWVGLNSFMHTHLWWHVALFRLSRGEFDEALRLYDAEVWGRAPDYSQDQVGAVSLLARIELAGAEVGGRWAALAPWLAGRAGDTVQPFLSMQYLYGLARARAGEADTLLAAVRARADAAPADVRRAWREAALPACEGLVAHARGRWGEATERLGAALPAMLAVGGSHAQRDLFEQVHLDAVLRSGDLVRAQQLLEARRAGDPAGVPVNRALADVYVRLGLPGLAQAARARIGEG